MPLISGWVPRDIRYCTSISLVILSTQYEFKYLAGHKFELVHTIDHCCERETTTVITQGMIQRFVSRTRLRLPSTSVYSRSPTNNLHRRLRTSESSSDRQSAQYLPLPALLQARTSTGGLLSSGGPAPTEGASSRRRLDSRVCDRRVHLQARNFAISANNCDNPPPVMRPSAAVDTERSGEGLKSPTVEGGLSTALGQQRNPEGDNVPVLAAPRTAAQLGFKITRGTERYSRWMTLYDRTVQFPAHGSHPVRVPLPRYLFSGSSPRLK